MDTVNIISVISTSVAAIAACVAAIAAVGTIFVYRKQIKVSQDQVKASLEQVQVSLKQTYISQDQLKLSQDQIYDQHRPVLILTVNQQEKELVLENAGAGVALNIRGIGFSPKSDKYLDSSELRILRPLPVGRTTIVDWYDNRFSNMVSKISGNSKIMDSVFLTLQSEDVNRITITYHDILGQKHASIFDDGNRCVGILFNIPKDLDDIEHDFNMHEKLSNYIQQQCDQEQLKNLEWDEAWSKIYKVAEDAMPIVV